MKPTHRVPDRQQQAFGRALCERLGIDPDLVGQNWNVNIIGDDFAEVQITAFLPAQDVIDMFNAAGKA